MMSEEASIQAAIAGELRLLEQEVRCSASLMGDLIDPEFVEIGASGRLWDRDSIIAALTEDPEPLPAPIEATEMTGVLLAPGLVHLTYVSNNNGRRARRSSLWRYSVEKGWRVYFHQGTLSAY
ncbi:DUF4440 domain-containing protein [Nonomuraea indica]|uniref:nuclear transport factor 2 family protein n=1 Tax=Nonomuraea indica TaxID=1581193 RepID=UPI001C5CF27C|nr:DUF4440 domain-containing protein [Nonomuraea indica]